MKLSGFGILIPNKLLIFFFGLISFIILISSCAMIPVLDTYRTDKIAHGPEFTPYTGLKRRIAVLDFENYSELGGKKLGGAVVDQLVSQLARSDRYILIERSRIDNILEEQALGQSGAITEDTAPQVGRLLGVESLVIGKILDAKQETGKHEIDNEKKKWSFKLKATIGVVHISYKMVNTTTGEILYANDVSETEIKPGFGLKTKDFDFENMYEFDQTVLGIAVRKAVNKISQDIVSNVSLIDWIGKVVQTKADTVIYFTPGLGAGVQTEQLFDIYECIDLESEELPGEAPVAYDQPKARVIVVGFIGDRVARAKVIQGKNIRRSDIVKLVKHKPNNSIE